MNILQYLCGLLIRALSALVIFYAVGDALDSGFKEYGRDGMLLSVGVALAYFGLRLIRSAKKKAAKGYNSKATQQREKLISNAHMLNVDLTLCEIKWTGHDAVVEMEDNTDESLTFLLPGRRYGLATDEPPTTTLPQSVISYNCMYNNASMQFVSDVIYKDKSTLSFLLTEQGFTTLYIDKNDSSQYWFDISFLETTS